MSIAEHLESAINDWRSALEPDCVSTAPDVLDRYARTTGIQSTRPLAVLFPRSTEDTVSLVKIAFQRRIPLHPISKGKNWGYGDATPPGPGQVIVDFSRMNRILELNRESAYVVVEPGVTQGQLARCLADNGGGLWMDSTGAGPEASLVGNALDRGFGHTRYGDHFQTFCGLQIVLADGRVLDTGFGHFKEARARWVFRYGIGPFLDGIFSQSNFGIVTRMGLWLMPEPETFRAFFFSTPDDAKISDLVDRLSPLKKQALLPSAVHIANDLRALSARLQYPWERAGGRTPMPEDLRAQLRREHGVGAWNGCGALMGPKKVVAAVESKIKSALKSYYTVFLDDRKLALGTRVLGGLSRCRLLRFTQSAFEDCSSGVRDAQRPAVERRDSRNRVARAHAGSGRRIRSAGISRRDPMGITRHSHDRLRSHSTDVSRRADLSQAWVRLSGDVDPAHRSDDLLCDEHRVRSPRGRRSPAR